MEDLVDYKTFMVAADEKVLHNENIDLDNLMLIITLKRLTKRYY